MAIQPKRIELDDMPEEFVVVIDGREYPKVRIERAVQLMNKQIQRISDARRRRKLKNKK
ncbi:hypothetical protein D3C78_17930 [compost metagenome]